MRSRESDFEGWKEPWRQGSLTPTLNRMGKLRSTEMEWLAEGQKVRARGVGPLTTLILLEVQYLKY